MENNSTNRLSHAVPSGSTKPSVTPTDASSAARRQMDPAEDLVKPSVEKERKYPDSIAKLKGKWGERARAIADYARENGMSLNDPLVKFAMVFCAVIGKYAGYADMIPGKFRSNLDKGDLSKEAFDDQQKKLLRERAQKEIPNNMRDFITLYDAENAKRKTANTSPLGVSESSTLFVSYLLFGNAPELKHLTNPKVLAARLSHENVDQKRTYGDKTLQALKKTPTVPRGSVIFFAPNFKTGILTAYATGNRDEFIYFVPGEKDRKSFHLSSKTSPVKSELSLMAAFVPINLSVPSTSSRLVDVEKVPPPATMLSSLKKTVADAQTSIASAMKQPNFVLKYTKSSQILAVAITKLEEGVKKAKSLPSNLSAQIKEALDAEIAKYRVLVQSVVSTWEKDRANILELVNTLPKRIKTSETTGKTADAKKLHLKLMLALAKRASIPLVKPWILKIREYLVRLDKI